MIPSNTTLFVRHFLEGEKGLLSNIVGPDTLGSALNAGTRIPNHQHRGTAELSSARYRGLTCSKIQSVDFDGREAR